MGRSKLHSGTSALPLSKLLRRKYLERAAYAVVESLERRMLMTNVTIEVMHSGDDAGTAMLGGTFPNYTAAKLRDAMTYADASPNPCTITFANSMSTTLTNGPIPVSSSYGINIQGTLSSGVPGITINGDGFTRDFIVTSSASATFFGLNVTGGFTSSNAAASTMTAGH